MKVVEEMVSFDEVMNNAWSGAVDVCKEICRQHRTEEAMEILEAYLGDDYVTATAVNDFVWFELADIMNLYGDNKEDAEVED